MVRDVQQMDSLNHILQNKNQSRYWNDFIEYRNKHKQNDKKNTI